ncbi:hypothetical protein AXF19_00860 [Selenomonas sp. oral taxon 126]|nr:hypothetical protein AXF19_00860 [Selenomonas sp. oral taxon 126]
MKRVGIITITSGMNYGNSLQNLALIMFLRDMGVEAETILNRHRCSHIPLQGLAKLKSMLTILLNYKGNGGGERLDLIRQKKYLEFDRKYIPFSKTMIVGGRVPETLKNEYDFFITGSDIVWNPFYCTPVMFLQFAKKVQRISYAASFGISALPAKHREQYATWLSDMQAISVRENAGSHIVEECIGTTPPVHIDPTLLIPREQWEELAQKPDWYHGQRYMLTYCLGNPPDKYQRDIVRICEEHVLENIRILDESFPEGYTVDPCEFLYLVFHAELIYTDSFHGAVFSTIFERPFIVFAREETQENFCNITSRIENLLTMFSLEDRLLSSTNKKCLETPFLLHFDNKDEILKKERECAKLYLEKALGL